MTGTSKLWVLTTQRELTRSHPINVPLSHLHYSCRLSAVRDRSNTPDLSVGGPLWFALRVRFGHTGEMALPQLGTGETLAPASAEPVPASELHAELGQS